MRPVTRDDVSRFEGARLKMPRKAWEQPRPTQNIAGTESFNVDRGRAARPRFYRDFA